MRLQYLGHSCFRLISDTGTTIVCDPYDSNMVGMQMMRTRTDVVTVSHHHADHDCTDSIVGSFALLDEKVACACDDVAIDGIDTWHDEEQGAKRGKNTVFTFSVDGLRVVHMGDIGFVDDKVVDIVRGCDVLLQPVGGIFTVDATQAAQLVEAIQPKIVVPMHFMTEEHAFQLGSLQDFLQICAENGWQIVDNGADAITLDDAPDHDGVKVVVLHKFED